MVGLGTTFGLFCIPDKFKRKFDKVSKPPRKVKGEDGKTIYVQSEDSEESSSSGGESVRRKSRGVTIEITPSRGSHADPMKKGLL